MNVGVSQFRQDICGSSSSSKWDGGRNYRQYITFHRADMIIMDNTVRWGKDRIGG